MQIEDLKEVPAQAQKSIDDLNKKQERLEKEKQKEEVKLKEVMDSLKTETQVLLSKPPQDFLVFKLPMFHLLSSMASGIKAKILKVSVANGMFLS